MRCPNCGTELPQGTRFCTRCGTPLPEAAPAGPQKNMQKILVIVLAIIAAICVVAAILVFIFAANKPAAESESEVVVAESIAMEESAAESSEEEAVPAAPAAEESSEEESPTDSSVEETAEESSAEETSIPESSAEAPAKEESSVKEEAAGINESTIEQEVEDMLSADDYVLPDSDKVYLTDADVRSLSKDELRIARNEIFARHGRLFKDAELQAYFNSKPWYKGTIAPDDFDNNVLSEVEKANIELIKKYE